MNQIISKKVVQSTIQVSENIDFILYMLAHLDTNNVASNYDQEYIDLFASIKSESSSALMQKLKPLANGSYAYISFLPVIIPDLNLVYQILNTIYTSDLKILKSFSNDLNLMMAYLLEHFEVKDRLTLPDFIQCCQNEYTNFYQSYWLSQQSVFNDGIDLFLEMWNAPDNQVMLKFFQSQQKTRYMIYLSESMRVYGRGISLAQDTLTAISKIPVSKNDLFYTYFIVIHEMLHQSIDQVTIQTLNLDASQRNLNQNEEGFDIHMYLETAVFYMHFLLSERQNDDYLKQYFLQLSKVTGNSISSKADLLHFYPLNDLLIQKLERILN